jgi:energy-coupling factor transporter ATP-binding protein EcfA2
MDRVLLLLQTGNDPVPLDFRDLVSAFNNLDQINDAIADFGPEVTEKYQVGIEAPIHEPRDFLARLSLGSSIAENELRDLSSYYIYTDEFRRAERGEVQVVVGRKGSGKTALFARLRDRLRRQQQRIVLDLQPEGFQLLKLKEQVLSLMEQGTKEHTLAAFWEYLLLLEVAYKILEKDKTPHTRNHELYEPYRELAALYHRREYTAEGDFAERMQWLIDDLHRRFSEKRNPGDSAVSLNRAELTELLYTHDVPELRRQIQGYLKLKDGLWLLFDNLDKGWPAAGLTPDDLLIVRALLDAVNNLRRTLTRQDIECNGVVFLRNDVYDLLLKYTPDRGKTARVEIDWKDPDLLREMLLRRLVFSGANPKASFQDVWQQMCVSHVKGEESSQYLIDRCLMRPRSLIDLVGYCRSHAVNLRKQRIDEDDIAYGERQYSTETVHQIGYEIHDVVETTEEVLYEFIGASRVIHQDDMVGRLQMTGATAVQATELIRLLLWFGVIGLPAREGEATFIYDVNYDIARLLKMREQMDVPRFEINRAFWTFFDITD